MPYYAGDDVPVYSNEGLLDEDLFSTVRTFSRCPLLCLRLCRQLCLSTEMLRGESFSDSESIPGFLLISVHMHDHAAGSLWCHEYDDVISTMTWLAETPERSSVQQPSTTWPVCLQTN
jgi:hypothetical protein